MVLHNSMNNCVLVDGLMLHILGHRVFAMTILTKEKDLALIWLLSTHVPRVCCNPKMSRRVSTRKIMG